MVELRRELRLIFFAAGDEQYFRILGAQQGLDGVFAPHLTAVRSGFTPPVVSVDNPTEVTTELL